MPISHCRDPIWAELQAFQFDDPHASLTFTQRLARENGWSVGYADRVVDEYRRFVFLAATGEDQCTPSDQVDQAWHLHLTYTHSYWDDLCSRVLAVPLHHGPTRGGSADGSRFHRQYQATLVRYRETFNEEPPVDIWPPAAERFGNPTRFVRIDKHRTLTIPKPWAIFRPIQLSRPKSALYLGAPLMLLAFANPFELNGAGFLAFYITLMSSIAIGAAILRYFLRGSQRSTRDQLDCYQIACLARDTPGAVQTAVVSLVQQGSIEVGRFSLTGIESKDLRVRLSIGKPDPQNELESRVISACEQVNGVRFDEIMKHADTAAQKIRHRLEDWGLLVPRDGIQACVWMPVCLMLAGLVVGAIRLFIGFERNAPVGYLILVLLAGLLVTLLLSRHPLRTLRGDAYLSQLRNEHDRWKSKSQLKRQQPSDNQIAMAAALFGLPVVAMGSLALVDQAWRYRAGPVASNSSSGCGGTVGADGGGDGGGCGSGCGGCGGCGG